MSPSRRFAILLLLVGAAAGSAVSFAVLYRTSGRDTAREALEALSLVSPSEKQFAQAHTERIVEVELTGVRSPTNPGWKVRRGLDVLRVATGFTAPVNLVHAPRGEAPDDPMLYVTELHGNVKYVTRSGEVGVFATGLKNFDPTESGPDTNETGLIGLAAVPGTEDLLVTTVAWHEESGTLRNRVLRLVSEPGGRSASRIVPVLDLPEPTSPSHQIQCVLVGPDGKVWVSVGDGFQPQAACDVDRFAGKVLRFELDGSPCEDNPFFQDSEESPGRRYAWAMGFRNAFGMAFDPRSGRLYLADNGMNIDRVALVARGGNYGWDGTQRSTRLNALFSWGPVTNPGPAGMAFLDSPVLGPGTDGRFYVAMFGTPADGFTKFREIWEFVLDPSTGLLSRPPAPVIKYVGPGSGSAAGLCSGDDGLFFADPWGVAEVPEDATGAGTIWKVVASEATVDLAEAEDPALAELSPVQRGRRVFIRNCATCHQAEGYGGTEGPDLSHLLSYLRPRLASHGYEFEATALRAGRWTESGGRRERIDEVLAAEGDARIRIWLHHHIVDPAFDNRSSKMPSFESALDETRRRELVEFLLTLK